MELSILQARYGDRWDDVDAWLRQKERGQPCHPLDVVLYRAVFIELIRTTALPWDLLTRLARFATQHLTRYGVEPGQRVFAHGPPASGKTTTVERLADAMRVPFVHVDLTSVSGAGFGLTLGDALAETLGAYGTRAADALILLDEAHHLGVRPTDTGNVVSSQAERQSSLLSVWTGVGEVRGYRHAVGVPIHRPAVVVAGVFDPELLVGGATPEALRQMGFMPELASRLAGGECWAFEPPSVKAVAALLAKSPQVVAALDQAERLGMTLEVAPEARAYLAGLVARDAGGATVRSAIGALVEAVNDRVVRMLDHLAKAQPTVRPNREYRHVITPDDVRLPAAPPPERWRDTA